MARRSIEALRQGMESIRSALKGMKPGPEELGIQRLRALLDQFTATNSIATQLVHTGDLSLITPRWWATILDNAREALTNFVKHSSARSVKASINLVVLAAFAVAFFLAAIFGFKRKEETGTFT